MLIAWYTFGQKKTKSIPSFPVKAIHRYITDNKTSHIFWNLHTRQLFPMSVFLIGLPN